MKYLKSLGFIFIPILVLGMILTTLYYFDIVGSNLYYYMTIAITILSFLVGGIYLGKNSKQKGWLEGLKIGFGISILFFIINFLAFEKGISIKNLIYYLIILATTTTGSMFGIRNVKVDK